MKTSYSHPKVYIILINWNSSTDTIACLEALKTLNYEEFEVIICDNASCDNAIKELRTWLAEQGQCRAVLYQQWGVKFDAKSELTYVLADGYETGTSTSSIRVNLLCIDRNLGYAGGNNIGIRFALQRSDFGYIWLLNNDTVPDSMALALLVNKMKQKSSIGICGSTLYYYDSPSKVQANGGGKYSPTLGTTREIQQDIPPEDQQDLFCFSIESALSYVSGASMLVSATFLRDVGLMAEEYFLYFEELDWAVRGARAGYTLGYEPGSRVLHKEGASIGTDARNPKAKSITADYYGIRNRLRFSFKFFPMHSPSVYLGVLAALVNRLRRRQWLRALMVADIILFPMKDHCRFFNERARL